MLEEKNIYTPANDSVIKTSVSLISFNKDFFSQKDVTADFLQLDLKEENKRYWVKVVGLKDIQFINRVCEKYGIHPLAEEDIIHTNQRPKVDEFEDSLFVVLKMFYVKKNLFSQQVSFFIKDNLVISFEEDDYPIFDNTISKLKMEGSAIRNKGEDYLLYNLLDTVIDAYFVIEEKIDAHISKLEDEVNKHPHRGHLNKLIRWRKQILQTRRGIAPVFDVIQTLIRLDISFFEKVNKIYLRDLNDHILRAIDHLDTHKESVNSLIELYHAQVNNKMNEVMKTLTIMSSIFIPLSFIASLYGMNFKYMPELQIETAYFYVLGVMASVAISLLVYFRYKKYY